MRTIRDALRLAANTYAIGFAVVWSITFDPVATLCLGPAAGVACVGVLWAVVRSRPRYLLPPSSTEYLASLLRGYTGPLPKSMQICDARPSAKRYAVRDYFT